MRGKKQDNCMAMHTHSGQQRPVNSGLIFDLSVAKRLSQKIEPHLCFFFMHAKVDVPYRHSN